MILLYQKCTLKKLSVHISITAVKPLFCMSISMQVVPESQVTCAESEKSTAPYLLLSPSAPVQVKEFALYIQSNM